MRWGNALMVFLCLALTGVLFAAGGDASVMFVICALAGLLVCSLATAWLGMAGTNTMRQLARQYVASGEQSEVHVEWVRSTRWPLPWLEIRDHWLHQGTGARRIVSRLVFPWFRTRLVFEYGIDSWPRGVYRLELTEVCGGDWFGLAQRTRGFTGQTELTVYPQPLPLTLQRGSNSGLQQTITMRSYQVEEDWSPQLREYVMGDPLNRIHWKATAKSGEWQVRETMEEQSETLDLYIEPGTRDKDDFERNIRLAAGICLKEGSRYRRIRIFSGQDAFAQEGLRAFQWEQTARWLAGLQPDYSSSDERWLAKVCASSSTSAGHFIFFGSSIDERIVRKLKLIRMTRGKRVTLVYTGDSAHSAASLWHERLRAVGIAVLSARETTEAKGGGAHDPAAFDANRGA